MEKFGGNYLDREVDVLIPLWGENGVMTQTLYCQTPLMWLVERARAELAAQQEYWGATINNFDVMYVVHEGVEYFLLRLHLVRITEDPPSAQTFAFYFPGRGE